MANHPSTLRTVNREGLMRISCNKHKLIKHRPSPLQKTGLQRTEKIQSEGCRLEKGSMRCEPCPRMGCGVTAFAMWLDRDRVDAHLCCLAKRVSHGSKGTAKRWRSCRSGCLEVNPQNSDISDIHRPSTSLRHPNTGPYWLAPTGTNIPLHAIVPQVMHEVMLHSS